MMSTPWNLLIVLVVGLIVFGVVKSCGMSGDGVNVMHTGVFQ